MYLGREYCCVVHVCILLLRYPPVLLVATLSWSEISSYSSSFEEEGCHLQHRTHPGKIQDSRQEDCGEKTYHLCGVFVSLVILCLMLFSVGMSRV